MLSGRCLLCLSHLPTDGLSAVLHNHFDLCQKLFRRHALLVQQPAFHGTEHRVSKKLHDELIRLLLPKQMRNAIGQKRPDILTEMVTEGVLPFDLQRFAVKCVVFIKIPANFSINTQRSL